MALDISSYSAITKLVDAYSTNETEKLVTPVTKKQTRSKDISTGYTDLSKKLDAFKTELVGLKQTGADSVFATRAATSSDTKFVTATATSAASTSSFDLRIDQLAKSDIAVSPEAVSATTNAITGTHSFTIKTGDGTTGEYTSNIDIDFTASETNKTVMEKIRDAINFDKAVVTSDAKVAATAYSGGSSSFKINLNGSEQTISLTGGGTYGQLVEEAIAQITANASLGGIAAEKVVDSPTPGDVKLKLTVSDSSKYISISHLSGFDVVTDLNIGVTKEKAASAIVSASVFAPDSSNSQFSLTAKTSGLNNRITNIADTGTSTAMATIGLNLGSTRPVFNQSTIPDTAGFVYADITQDANLLNAKIQFNGLNFQRNTNSVSDLVNGVTFNLKSVMQASDTTVNVAVATDNASIKTKVESLISKFNDVYTFIDAKSERNFGEKGIFTGDSNTSSLLDSFTSNLSSQIPGIAVGDFCYLSQIGITFNSTTGLSISNSTLFDNNLTDKISQVEALFNSSSGIANTLYNKINPYLGAAGYLATSKKSLDDNVSYMETKITAMKKRIDKRAEIMRKQYEGLQSQLVTLNMNASLFGINANVL
ncbi:MAG: flagellar filament capping protein FliD [Ignavibacteria bacterium]|nr:flagellar filament capping protein FliD [Ignavibacteria bacterium]